MKITLSEKKLEAKLWLLLVAVLTVILSATSCSAQQNPTYKSVIIDSLRARLVGGKIWLSDGRGDIAWLRVSGDSLYFGDATGEKSLGSLSSNGISAASHGLIINNDTVKYDGSNIYGSTFYGRYEELVSNRFGGITSYIPLTGQPKTEITTPGNLATNYITVIIDTTGMYIDPAWIPDTSLWGDNHFITKGFADANYLGTGGGDVTVSGTPVANQLAVFTNSNTVKGGLRVIDTLSNIGLGTNALIDNTSGNYNVGLGTNALNNNTVGINNIGLGTNALIDNTSGNYNVAMGYYSLIQNTSGDYNVGLGTNALNNNTVGNYNIAIGYSSGYHLNKSNRLYISSIIRSSQAEDTTKAIIYGYQDNLVANQKLYVNADLIVSGDAYANGVLLGSGGTTPTDGIWDWQTDKYALYSTPQTTLSFSSSSSAPGTYSNGLVALNGKMIMQTDANSVLTLNAVAIGRNSTAGSFSASKNSTALSASSDTGSAGYFWANHGKSLWADTYGNGGTNLTITATDSTNVLMNVYQRRTIFRMSQDSTNVYNTMYIKSDLKADTCFLFKLPTGKVVSGDSVSASFGLWMPLPSISDYLSDSVNGEIAWYYQDSQGNIVKQYGITNPFHALEQLQAMNEINLRYTKELNDKINVMWIVSLSIISLLITVIVFMFFKSGRNE